MRARDFVQEVNDPGKLSLDPWTFDQTDQGWRSLSQPRAISAIRDYISKYVRQGRFVNAPKGMKKLDPRTLYWHLGQLLAMAGDRDSAVSAMRSSLGADQDWNDYAQATIAFLANNKPQFEKYVDRPNSNSETIKRLAAGWGRPYKDAY